MTRAELVATLRLTELPPEVREVYLDADPLGVAVVCRGESGGRGFRTRTVLNPALLEDAAPVVAAWHLRGDGTAGAITRPAPSADAGRVTVACLVRDVIAHAVRDLTAAGPHPN